jgi:hypothetical protein
LWLCDYSGSKFGRVLALTLTQVKIVFAAAVFSFSFVVRHRRNVILAVTHYFKGSSHRLHMLQFPVFAVLYELKKRAKALHVVTHPAHHEALLVIIRLDDGIITLSDKKKVYG